MVNEDIIVRCYCDSCVNYYKQNRTECIRLELVVDRRRKVDVYCANYKSSKKK
jgi:hypothetical protein